MSPRDLTVAAAAILRRVHQRLADPASWTQGDFARSVHGEMRLLVDTDACAWCLEAALMLEWVDSEAYLAAHAALCDTLGLTTCGLTLAGWNDCPGREHQEVLDVLTFTAARLEREAATQGAAA